MKQLLVMRHAKSDWSVGRPDHDRPLNNRGVEAAKTIGRALTAMNEVPDIVVTSTATRAASTARLAAEAGSWDAPIIESASLYGTSAHGALEVAMETDPAAGSLMLVGHQPTWGSLVAHLTGAAVAMKTATVAKIELYIRDWSEAAHARGELTLLLQPRSLGRLFDGG